MKILTKLLALCLCLFTVLSLCACQMDNLVGSDGKSAYDIAVEHGFEGSEEEWLESLKGDKGDQGPQGKPGLNGDNGEPGKDGLNAPASLDGQLESSFVVVTEYLEPNTGKDLTLAIQEIINTNPNRTIYFPDGEYIVSAPIKTSAKYDKSVSLLLSNYAEIKAASTWEKDAETAVIMLGAAEPYNNVSKPGSNYYLKGGIINGNGVANGVFIDSGRETLVSEVSIKGTPVGLRIKWGANSGSSDADIRNINIYGTCKSDSVGIIVEGYDNTLEKIRIGGVKIGVRMKVGGNFLRDIHPLLGGMSLYEGSIGFYNEGGGNWYDLCYSDQFETGFKVSNSISTFINCYCYWWYSNAEHKNGYQVTGETGFYFPSKFNSIIQNSRVNFNNSGDTVNNSYMKVGAAGGTGTVINPIMNEKNDNETYKDYVK